MCGIFLINECLGHLCRFTPSKLIHLKVKVLVAGLCPTLCDPLPMGSSRQEYWGARNGVGCHLHLQETCIFGGVDSIEISIYNVVLISSVQQSDSSTYVYIYFFSVLSVMVSHKLLSIVPGATQ